MTGLLFWVEALQWLGETLSAEDRCERMPGMLIWILWDDSMDKFQLRSL
jgi:hypothetical protein